jgi:hypothetical protein
MDPAPSQVGQCVETSKPFVRRCLTIGENRLPLLMVAAQEARERLASGDLAGIFAPAMETAPALKLPDRRVGTPPPRDELDHSSVPRRAPAGGGASHRVQAITLSPPTGYRA